jgi:hypothetical protein
VSKKLKVYLGSVGSIGRGERLTLLRGTGEKFRRGVEVVYMHFPTAKKFGYGPKTSNYVDSGAIV